MSLQKIDLNLLPVLRVLLREQSISRSAVILSLSQQAVSAALGRLRQTLGDKLLVKVGRQMVLTPAAIALVNRLEATCENLEDLFVRRGFDPATEKRNFVVSCPDIVSFLLAPVLISLLKQNAPHVSVRFMEINEDRLLDQFASRAVDLAIMPAFFLEDLRLDMLRFKPLFADDLVAMFRSDHPLAALDVIQAADFAGYRRITFQALQSVTTSVQRRRGKSLLHEQLPEVVMNVPQTTLLPFLLLEDHCFTYTSRRVAERMAKLLPLAYRDLGFVTASFDIGYAWSTVQDNEPGHRWFRQLIEQCAVPG